MGYRGRELSISHEKLTTRAIFNVKNARNWKQEKFSNM
jgi:hypothetical protein